MSVLASLDEVIAVLPSPSGRRLLVGITGAPGAGKTTLGGLLVERLGAEARLLSMDGFHLPQARLVELGRRDRMGAPDTFDVEGFVHLLELLRGPGDVRGPGFDRTIEEPIPGEVLIPASATIVIVEGNYLLLERDGWERVAPLLDVRLHLSVDRDTRLARLVARHERFGKTPSEARAWALGPDEANAEAIDATAGRADHILRLDS